MKAFKSNGGDKLDNCFIRIFNLYKNDIFRLAYSYTKNISDSEDITQNVFVKLYKHEDMFNNLDSDIKRWLVTVTINECKTYLLSTWKRKIFYLTEKEENILSQQTNSSDNLLEQILKLPKKYRTIIFLYYYEGYKIKEISKILKMSETNIQTILSRARKKLKEIIKETL